MKKYAIFFMAVLLLFVLISCQDHGQNDVPPVTSENEDSDLITESAESKRPESEYQDSHIPGEPLTIVKDSISEYKIVCIGNKLSIIDAANNLQKEIKEKTGCELPISGKREENPFAFEIVVGLSTVESGDDGIDRTGLNEDGYLLKAEKNRLLLTGNSTNGVQTAVQFFISKFVKSGDVMVSDDYCHVVKSEPGIQKMSIEGHDVSEYVIVCDMAASASVNHAASQLREYIEKACGTALEIVSTANGKPAIRLDHTSYSDDESFSIRSSHDGVVISGSPVRGILYGVYHFLEKYVGWKFLPYDTDVLTAEREVSIENIDDTYTPYFSFRDVHWTSFSVNRYAAKRMVNSNIGRWDDPNLGHFYGFTGNYVHTFAELLGISQDTQPCLVEEATYEKLLSGVMKILEENPDADIISVSQNDTPAFCTCSGCTGKDIGGNYTDALLQLINRVAEAVEKEYPNVMIHTLAYTVTRPAPKVVKPRHNVIVQLCSIECCFNHAINDDNCARNAAFKKDIEDWSKVCQNLYVWDYTTNFRFYLAPFPNFDVLASNIRFFYEHNVKGLFAQGNEFNLWGEFGELRAHLISELMNDPYMTEEKYEELINQFLSGYYGSGWRYIRNYLDFLMESSNKKDCFGIYATPDGMYVADDFIQRKDEIDGWFDAAEEAAEDLRSLKHIQYTRLTCSYLKWYFYYDEVIQSGNKEEIEKAKKACSELFDAIAAEQIRLMDVRAPLGNYANAVDKKDSPKRWDPLASTVQIPDNGFSN